jgi:hypothetical protein
MKRVAIIAAALAALMLAGGASAYRAPTLAERGQILTTLRAYVDRSSCCAVMKRIKVLGLRISTVDKRWAAVGIEGYDANGVDIGSALAVVHHGYLTGTWSIRDFGTAGATCPVPPAIVARDIGKAFLGYHHC